VFHTVSVQSEINYESEDYPFHLSVTLEEKRKEKLTMDLFVIAHVACQQDPQGETMSQPPTSLMMALFQRRPA